jgi:hormone-sensitive lipase
MNGQDTLVIHVHGGGFISMSSGSHQNYTRMWAKAMPNAIICSLDYRLAPESRFPAQIDDIWQAYYWLVINSSQFLGAPPKKIILTGDSAGGNLVLALTVMTIERKFRVPDGLVPSYASSIVSREEFWPSLLFSMDDLILTQSFLNLC